MTWTDPRTWVTSEVVTAAQLNAHVRDNELFLYEAFPEEIIETIITDGSSAALAANNNAHLTMMIVEREFVCTNVRFHIGTSSGNIDVGIYDSSFTRLWSRGSFASPGTGSRTVGISAGTPTTLTLTPGVYWFALAADNTTVTFRGTSAQLVSKSVTKGTSFPLPSSISSPSANTGSLAPCGLID
jgi:hypothetical protein